jgi:RNA polymerase sigma-70 factor (ECF subfamily)
MTIEHETNETPQLSSFGETSGPDSSPRPAKAKSLTQLASGRVDAAYEALKSDQPGAEEDLFEAFKSLAEIIAMRFFGMVDEDLIQESIIAGFSSRERFNGHCRFSTWFVSLVKHHCYKELHRIYSRQVRKMKSLSLLENITSPEDEESDGEPLDPELCVRDASHWINNRIDLEIAMEGLPNDQLHVIEMILEGRSDAEIACEDGLPIGTVKGRKRLGIARMREKISRRE